MMATRSSTLSIALASLCVLLAATSCSTPPPTDGFAIYLTRHNIAPSDMEMLSHVDLADDPIISMDEVVSYDASTHEMALTLAAYERLASMEVPLSGTSFVACVDGNPIYWGALWTPISSLSFDGVTIWQPLGENGSTVVQIRMGYPGPLPGSGEDPRNNPAMLDALEQAGKLLARPLAPPTSALHESSKGYELYSWQEGDEWHFTLITGTNRNKTSEEVLSREPLVTAEGWAHVHAIGVEELKTALSMLPEGEDVFWFPQFNGDGGEAITLPPQSIIEAVTLHSARCGLNLSVALH
jgi:hypothetical protein